MNSYQQGFKTEILNTIFSLTGKIWLKITGIQAITFIFFILIFVVAFASLIFSGGFGLFHQNMTNPSQMLEFYSDMIARFTNTPGLVVSTVIAAVLFMVIGAWTYYISFKMTDSQIRTNNISLGNEIMKSFNVDILRVLLVAILIYLAFAAGIFVGIMLAAVTGFLTFLVILAALILINKFLLVLPALIIGKMSIADAFAFSFKHITIVRALKIFLILIVASLAIFIAAIVIGLISSIFTFIPVLGQIVQIAIQIGFGALMTALTVSALTGLYYRYIDDIKEEDELKIDDLLVSE